MILLQRGEDASSRHSLARLSRSLAYIEKMRLYAGEITMHPEIS